MKKAISILLVVGFVLAMSASAVSAFGFKQNYQSEKVVLAQGNYAKNINIASGHTVALQDGFGFVVKNTAVQNSGIVSYQDNTAIISQYEENNQIL